MAVVDLCALGSFVRTKNVTSSVTSSDGFFLLFSGIICTWYSGRSSPLAFGGLEKGGS